MNIPELVQQWKHWKEIKTGRAISQKMIAIDAGISPSYLSDVMRGEKSGDTGKSIEKLARAFNVSTKEFLAGPPTAPHDIPPSHVIAEADMRHTLLGRLVSLESQLDEEELMEVIKFVEYRVAQLSTKKNIAQTS